MRNKFRFSTILAIIGCCVMLTSCFNKSSNKKSRTTGWKYNDPNNEYIYDFQNFQNFPAQKPGPGLVAIEGGTFTMGATSQSRRRRQSAYLLQAWRCFCNWSIKRICIRFNVCHSYYTEGRTSGVRIVQTRWQVWLPLGYEVNKDNHIVQHEQQGFHTDTESKVSYRYILYSADTEERRNYLDKYKLPDDHWQRQTKRIFKQSVSKCEE